MKLLIAALTLVCSASVLAQGLQLIEIERERGRSGGAVSPPLPPTPISNGSYTGDTNGARASAGLIEGTDGRLYGVTEEGGFASEAFPRGSGAVFSLNKDGSDYKVLHHFKADGRDGQNPQGQLVEGRYGALYGTTRDGGKYDKGTIFKLSKNGRGYYVI